MAKDTNKDEVQEEKVTEKAEDIEEYMEEEYEESGYKEHSFSLLDNPLEIFTVLFMIVYLVYVIWQFTNAVELGNITLQAGFEFWLGAITKLIPAIVLLVACEIYEKMQMLEYNVKINSYYMAQYQMTLVSKLDGDGTGSENEE